MMLKSLVTSAALFSIFCGSAVAQNMKCPSAEVIRQQPAQAPESGYIYEANGPDGSVWKGHNPEGQEGDLKTFVFSAAAYRAKSSEGNTDVVSCDYDGTPQNAFARMTLYSFRDWKGAQGAKWKVDQPAPDRVESCSSNKQADCEFEYSTLDR
ncbi:DUF3757 domain-containing protein [Pseudomonas sp. R3-18-08]|uniref:DUF3757 domain-containing protein n=1 Tax=Pseudomonas sp. R3-18-08 TaxID=1173283 RepID=UPI000F55D3EF|nr:DUF3757 domain-containing protein [Pseudomonas sp. R3-18-08]AZF18319.1 hypothetical protein C4J92_4882 [Pseudomonas sp. R3-18-08]